MTDTLIPTVAMSFDEAMDIYKSINDAIDETDEDILYIRRMLQEKAVRYAHFRAGWSLKTRQEKLDTDDHRTSAHDAFISTLNMMAAAEQDTGEMWRQKLGTDRKRLGDFACYIALFMALDAR